MANTHKVIATMDTIKEMHGDLARKYQLHRPRIEEIWRSIPMDLRPLHVQSILSAIEAGFLKDPRNRVWGDVYKVVPELDMRDINSPAWLALLDNLKHRATTSLFQQYCRGLNDGDGDQNFIFEAMGVNNIPDWNRFRVDVTLFNDDEFHGLTFEPDLADEELRNRLWPFMEAGFCMAAETGHFILTRQLVMMETLNYLVNMTLRISSLYSQTVNSLLSGSVKVPPSKPEEAARAALTKLSIVQKSEKLNLSDLVASALDQKTSLKDYMRLCCSEPVLLSHIVHIRRLSRPEFVPDEKGRTTFLLGDKYINVAVFEIIHNAIAAATIWDYLYNLLQLLVKESKNKVSKTIILQEISNVCHLEYVRVQKSFKRYVQTGSGLKYFRRVSGIYDDGVARVTLKGSPELLTRENPQLHYMLRLCATETNASKAVTWIKKLDDLHQCHPTERDKMSPGESECFGDLAVIVGFIQSLSTSLPLPSINLKKDQVFVSNSKKLWAELDPLKTQVDLSNFAIPIHNIMEPGMMEGALDALDRFVMEKTGSTMVHLYQDLTEECTSQIQAYVQRQKEKNEQNAKNKLSSTLAEPVNETPSLELRIQERREKHKTRPAHSSAYNTTPEPADSAQDTDTTQTPPPVFKVKKDTVEVFSTLFSKSESRGSIGWVAFEAAMADLSFSVMPKFGSVFTFFPPEDMGVQRSITFHRPHRSEIEGHVLLIFASRLKRVYGWGEQSFVVA